MNRRVLAALVTLAAVHYVKEDPEGDDEDYDKAFGRHGVAQTALSDTDFTLYEKIAELLCQAGESIQDDPVGARLLRAACSDELPMFLKDAAEYVAPRTTTDGPREKARGAWDTWTDEDRATELSAARDLASKDPPP